MKSYHLTFSSKNKKSLKLSSLLFLKENSYFQSKAIKKYFQRKTKKSFFTILKSPHVNKTAQEQFETRKSFGQLSICHPRNIKYLYYLKKIKNSMLSDVRIKTKISMNPTKNKNIRSKIFNPKKFLLVRRSSFYSQKRESSFVRTTQSINFKQAVSKSRMMFFLKTLCVFGELKVLNKFR